MFTQQPGITAIRLHRHNRPFEPLDNPRMLRMLQANQYMQGVLPSGGSTSITPSRTSCGSRCKL